MEGQAQSIHDAYPVLLLPHLFCFILQGLCPELKSQIGQVLISRNHPFWLKPTLDNHGISFALLVNLRSVVVVSQLLVLDASDALDAIDKATLRMYINIYI